MHRPLELHRRSTVLLATLIALAGLMAFAPSSRAASLAATTTAPVLTTSANLPFAGLWTGGVNMATGELSFDEPPDLGFGAMTPLTLEFSRHYGSVISREGLAIAHVGTNWLGTYDWRLFTDAGGALVVCDDQGEAMRFQPSLVGGPATQLNHLEERLVLAPAPAGAAMRLYRGGSDLVYELDTVTGHLNRIFDAHGNTLTCSYGADGQLATVSDGLGRVLTLTHDPSGNVTSVSDGTRTVSFGYTGGQLTSFTDAAGKVTLYTYAPGAIAGLLASVTEPAGNTPFTYAYDGEGRVISRTDALAHVWGYSYGPGIESFMTTPAGELSHAVLDGSQRLTSLADPLNRSTSLAYDASGRPVSLTRPLGDVTTLGYDATSGLVNDIGFADGSHVTRTFSALAFDIFTHYLPATTHLPDGTVETITYDPSGNPASFIDGAGQRWSRTFNTQGQLLSETNPAGGVRSWTFDAKLNPTASTDAAGNTSQYAYDALDRLVTLTHADATTVGMTYDALGRLLTYTDEAGKVWSAAYDANGSKTSSTDPLAHTRSYTHDALDRLTTDTDALGGVEHFAYDPDGHLMRLTDRSGRATTWAYDAAGELITQTDNAGHAMTFSYDANGRPSKVSDALGHAVLANSDVLDRITQITDEVGAVTQYSYDTMSRLTSLTAPLGHTETYGYDARGGLISLLDVSEHTSFTRNSLGEVTTTQDPNGNSWTNGYDSGGRPALTTDPLSRSIAYSYDARGRVNHVTNPVNTEDLVFDPVGRVAGLVFSGGLALGMTYDAAGRLTGANGASFTYDNADRLTSSNGITLTRDPDGRLLSITYESGKTVNYTRDAAGRVSGVTDWLGGGVSAISYDAANRVTGMTRSNGTSATYAYDAANHLTQWTEQGPGPVQLGAVTLSRDALGRVIGAARSVPLAAMAAADSVPFTYDAAGQTNGRTFDGLGRLTLDGARSFTWDGAGRMTGYVIGAESPAFTNDAFGREITRNDGDTVRQQVWNYGTATPSLAMINPGTAGEIIIVCTPSGRPLYQVDASGARTFYHFDEAGNLSFVTNDAGAVVASFAYSPTGQVSSSGSPAAANSVPFKFAGAAGAMVEGSSGLIRFGASVYDATLARNISRVEDQEDYIEATRMRAYFPTGTASKGVNFASPLGPESAIAIGSALGSNSGMPREVSLSFEKIHYVYTQQKRSSNGSKSSLFNATCAGKHFDKAMIITRTDGGAGSGFPTDCTLCHTTTGWGGSVLSMIAAHDPNPGTALSMPFTNVEWTYSERTKPSGQGPSTSISMTYTDVEWTYTQRSNPSDPGRHPGPIQIGPVMQWTFGPGPAPGGVPIPYPNVGVRMRGASMDGVPLGTPGFTGGYPPGESVEYTLIEYWPLAIWIVENITGGLAE